jgi:hypothetical protein
MLVFEVRQFAQANAVGEQVNEERKSSPKVGIEDC